MDRERPTQPPTAQPQATNDIPSQPEPVQALPNDGNGVGITGHRDGEIASAERHLVNPPPHEDHPTLSHSRSHDNPHADPERAPAPTPAPPTPASASASAPAPPPRPVRSPEGHVRLSSRRHTLGSVTGLSPAPLNGPAIDRIVPVDRKSGTRRTVGERLQPTIDHAVIERDKYAKKALWTGYTLNIAIAVQILLGALTTGIAAAASSGRQAQISTAILGGLSTLVASYLARARGSGEPELSITRTKDLEQFLRECKVIELDYDREYGTRENGLDARLDDLRRRFEELLGNANRERKLLPTETGQARAVP